MNIMACYFFRSKRINASGGKSIIASAAYRSGTKLKDEGIGETYSYKKPEVIYSEIILPDLPDEVQKKFSDRQTLWNSVHKNIKASNALLAKEFIIAIPKELTQQQSVDLIRKFAQSLAVNEQMITDVSVHWKPNNHHAHLLIAPRKMERDGSWAKIKERKEYELDEAGNKIPQLATDEDTDKIPLMKKDGQQATDSNGKPLFQKVRIRKGKGVEKLWKRKTVLANEWNSLEKLKELKKRWQDYANQALLENGYHGKLLDSRSYEERKVSIIPMVHEGYAARAIEARGGISYLCEHNRWVRKKNQEFFTQMKKLFNEKRRVESEIATLDKEWQEEKSKVAAPEVFVWQPSHIDFWAIKSKIKKVVRENHSAEKAQDGIKIICIIAEKLLDFDNLISLTLQKPENEQLAFLKKSTRANSTCKKLLPILKEAIIEIQKVSPNILNDQDIRGYADDLLIINECTPEEKKTMQR